MLGVENYHSTLLILFRWTDFYFPSSLQLKSHLISLLESVECHEKRELIELGLHEALVNAVIHGNSGDASKVVRVRRILTPNWLIWQIQDEGNGVPDHARLGSLPLQIDANRGRGLFLIYQCFDDVRWSRRGNRLQLACRREVIFSDEGILGPLLSLSTKEHLD